MDAFNVLAIALGSIGAVLGGLGVWKAREAMAIATACKRIAEQPQRAATDAAQIARDVSSAAKSPAQPSALPAPLLEKPKPIAIDNAQTAHIVVRSGSNTGEDLPTNQGSGSGLIGIFIVNQGPGIARDLRLTATFPNGAIRRSGEHHALSATKELTLSAEVGPQDFGPGTTLDILYRVAYRDGNGEHELSRKVRVDGGWKGPWKTFLELEDGVSRRETQLVDAPVSGSGDTAVHA